MKDFTNGLFRLPTKEERIQARGGASLNPFKLLAMLTPMQGLMYLSGWIAWTMDAWDFFSLSLSTSGVAETLFGNSSPANVSKITTAITLTLLFRSLGAAIFGLISDRYGRKWPLVFNLILIGIFSLGSGFIQTYPQFLALRCLFGIAMGGIWGLSASTALENVPAPTRGLLSGLLQQGYAAGYLFAASANIGWVEKSGGDNWRILFWMGCGLSFFAAAFRALLPESEFFLKQQREREERGEGKGSKGKTFMRELGAMLKANWGRCIFGVLLMTGFNFLSHSSQDLFPTMIKKTKLPLAADPADLASKATIVGNCGAIVGGILAGYISQYLGRRLTIILFVVMTGCLIPAWILPNTFGGLAAGAFFIQFGVQGAWGVIPIYLNEISPPAFRATFPGVAYQLGNMVSSASAQIEARGGESLTIANPCLKTANGRCPSAPNDIPKPTLPDYATVSGILLGVVCAFILMVIIFGKEYRGATFENAPAATVSGAGKVDLANEEKTYPHNDEESSLEHVGDHLRGDDASDEKKLSNEKN